jgi:deazaflavin-dependent oxidoreductase (nitroreductase family)
MSNKPEMKDDLKKRLARSREIHLTVTGRKSGRPISIPVWFVLEGGKLYLLPVSGSDTQWYKNVLQDARIRIEADGQQAEVKVAPITEAQPVSSVVEKFRQKYGAADVKKYYSKFDVAAIAEVA